MDRHFSPAPSAPRINGRAVPRTIPAESSRSDPFFSPGRTRRGGTPRTVTQRQNIHTLHCVFEVAAIVALGAGLRPVFEPGTLERPALLPMALAVIALSFLSRRLIG